MPFLRAVRSDGSVQDISEPELFRYTRHRWLYNESRQLSERYLKFDLEQLLQVAVMTMSKSGAYGCTEVLKCEEGLNNKVYLLTMDNGTEVIAKLPNPCAGPSFYTTASEVATREFLREGLGVPLPHVLAWSANKNNVVGAEYILEEKAPGQPLGKLWQNCETFPMESRVRIIGQVVDIESKLASVRFLKSGCIYFKDDIPDGAPLATLLPFEPSILQRFKLGPLIKIGFWDGVRARIPMDRGPYSTPLDFVKALAINERRFIDIYACPRMNYARSLTEPELPKDMLELLAQYIELAPAMTPPAGPNDALSATLWHPDLHLNNIFIDPATLEITQIIDWQGAAALPFFHQCGVPTMCKHKEKVSLDLTVWPKRPEHFNSLTQREQEKVDKLIKSELLHKYYLAITQRKNSRHWDAIQSHDEIRKRPIQFVQSVWEDGDTSFLRRALMAIIDQWEELCPHAGPCPVHFDEEEIPLHKHEEENREYIGEVLYIFKTKWGVPPGGMIETARFDQVRPELDRMRAAAVDLASNDEDKFLADKLWPYQDTPKEQTRLLEQSSAANEDARRVSGS